MPTDSLAPIRRSIEVEYWVIDEKGRLTSPGDLVDASPGAEREFVKPMLEIKTSPCETATELREELLGRIRDVLRRADSLNKGLVPLATSLNRDHIQELPSDRTRIQSKVFGENFRYVRHCAGTHIHFEQQPGCVIDQLNALIGLDPALALVNSGRHFEGHDMGTGARSRLYRRMAYKGFPHQGRLWPYVADRTEWDRRLDECYNAFRTQASTAGVDEDTFNTYFDPDLPECAVWTPVKLRARFGTVEWRSPDTALPSQVLRMADTMASIMDRLRNTDVRIGKEPSRIREEEVVFPSFDTLMDRVDAAIREGLSSKKVQSYLNRMGFDVDAYTPISETFDSDAADSVHDARRLRLKYAERLREDVHEPQLLSAEDR